MSLLDFFTKSKATAKPANQLVDLIAPSAFKITPNYIQIGEKCARTLFVFQYPRYLNTNWLTPVISLDRTMNIAMFFHPAETTSTLTELRKKTAQIQSQITTESEEGQVRNPVLETALEDIENLRDVLQQGQEKFFKFSLYITIFGADEKELDKTENEIRSLLETKLVYLKPAIFEQEQGFLSTLPLANDKLGMTTGMNATPISSAFPFVSANLTSGDGILYGINRHNNSLILFDRFQMPNYNTIVFAQSGAGKSFAIKLECLRSLMMGTDIIIIDPENEYKYLAETVGGTYFKVSLSSPNHINPLDLPPIPKDESASDIFRSNVINVIGLMRMMLGGLTPEEDAIMDTAIIATYAARDITPDSDFSKTQAPTLSDLQMILQSMEGGKSLATRMEKYTKGSYSAFFNQPTNIQLKNNLVVFSIRDLEEELRPLAMYIILHYIWNTVRAETKKRILVVDEAWVLMKYADGASFLAGIAKRARKYYLGLTIINQDIPEFLNSDYGKPILNNSAIQILLRQSPSAIDIITKTFNLTDEEKYLLLEAKVGEGLFFAGLQHVAIHILASYSEDQIITSDPRQLLEIERAKEEFAKTQN